METADTFDWRLAEIARRYGRHALTDPVALRAALRETGVTFTEAELHALTAAAGSPELAELLRERGGVAPAESPTRQAIDGAAERIAARTGLPVSVLGWACAALVAALRPPPGAEASTLAGATLGPKQPLPPR